MTHRMIQVNEGELPPNLTEWKCPICFRHVKKNSDTGKTETIKSGDEYANHSGDNLHLIGEYWERDDTAATFDFWSKSWKTKVLKMVGRISRLFRMLIG